MIWRQTSVQHFQTLIGCCSYLPDPQRFLLAFDASVRIPRYKYLLFNCEVAEVPCPKFASKHSISSMLRLVHHLQIHGCLSGFSRLVFAIPSAFTQACKAQLYNTGIWSSPNCIMRVKAQLIDIWAMNSWGAPTLWISRYSATFVGTFWL